MDNTNQMSEPAFRALAQDIYERIDRAFEDIDPDDAECEISQGALTISLPGGAKWILSQQPPVRQMWLAVASLGRAYHFNYDSAAATWIDGKDAGNELLSLLTNLLRDNAHIDIAL